MSDTKYISKVPTGYLVRKAINGRIYQGFFGESKYGSDNDALTAAKDYRDKMLRETQGQRSFQRRNLRNVTGVVGVAWHCRYNRSRNDAVIHSLRAQVSDDDGKASAKAWSVQRYGLWGAYEQAVRWRNMLAFGKATPRSEITKSFLSFLSNYLEEMEHKEGRVKEEIHAALIEMLTNEDVPKAAIDMLPPHIKRRFTTRRACTP